MHSFILVTFTYPRLNETKSRGCAKDNIYLSFVGPLGLVDILSTT